VGGGPAGFLGRLTEDDRARLAAAGRERTFQPGDVLMTQGSPSDAIALLLTGAVRVAAVTPEGAEVTLSLRAAGDVLGTLGALTDPPAPRAATIVALVTSRARLIATGAFLQVLHDRPAIAVALLSDVAHEWREASERHLQFSAYPAEQRLARLLVELVRADGDEHAGTGATIDLPLSQTDLAGMIGASRDSAVRLLGRFRDEGLVTTGRRSVQIVDLPGLRARAHPAG
jgi:CRP/FNR family cyclic AMP-dependent transcriptional regulator